jgi:hypothetical protein
VAGEAEDGVEGVGRAAKMDEGVVDEDTIKDPSSACT